MSGRPDVRSSAKDVKAFLRFVCNNADNFGIHGGLRSIMGVTDGWPVGPAGRPGADDDDDHDDHGDGAKKFLN